ncbi:MAG: ABC transporter permease [Leptospiraceae bacterium]|nr:ABC transporter permease [Leptospiraceae bacterium]
MLKFAYRNLRRNSRRSYITLVSIIFAAMLINFFRFLAYGIHQENIRQAVSLTTGFVQVAAFGWAENRPLQRALDVNSQLFEKIQVQGVKMISPRIEAGALLSFKTNSRFVRVLAADPEKEREVTNLENTISNGRIFSSTVKQETKQPNIYEMVAGERLARRLGLQIGDTAALSGGQFDGSVGAILVKLTGTLKSNQQQIDDTLIWVSLPAGEELFNPSIGTDSQTTRYTSLALGLQDINKSPEIITKLREYIPTPFDDSVSDSSDSQIFDPEVLDWTQLNPGLEQYLKLDNIGNEISNAFLILIMAFGVLTTLEISIHERTREFGIMLAIGTPHSFLVSILIIETLLLLGVGSVIGSSLGAAASYYLEVNPIELTGELADSMIAFGSLPLIRAKVVFSELGIGLATLLIPSFLMALLGIRKVTRLEPIQVISTL